MARLPDLVQDSKLETHFLPSSDSSVETVHTYHEPDPTSQRRLVSRSEHWQRQWKIGGGSSASVWLEKCTKGGHGDVEVRAIKQIEIHRHSGRILDFGRELEAIAKFSHRKYERCFVKSFGWYESREYLFIAMEYLELGDLHTYLDREPRLPEHEAKEVTYQILDGLNFMHDNGFAHRDLKPNNILLKSRPPNDWWIKIADFGISKRIDDGLGKSTTFKGTLGYIAPELHGFTEKGSPDAVDIWALGEIAFQMLTKRPTFKHLGLLSVYVDKPETFPSNLLLAAQVSQPGVEFILSIMHPIPVDRITAGKALRHRWMDRSSSYPATPVAPIASAIDSVTEDLATWNTTMSAEAPTTVVSRKNKEFGASPLRTSRLTSDETVRFHSVQSTASRSSDGELVVSASDDRRLRDPEEPRQAPRNRTLKGHSDWVNAVAFSPDGKLVASGSNDMTVRLWDPTTGAEHSTLKGHSDQVNAVAFSGKLVASASNDMTVRLWDPATGAEHSTLKGHSGRVKAVAFSPDGKMLASTSVDKTDPVRLWDPATGVAHRTLLSHAETVAFSPDGNLAVPSIRRLNAGIIRRILINEHRKFDFWDPATGAIRSMFYVPRNDIVSSMAFSPDGKLLAYTSTIDNQYVMILDLRTRKAWSTPKGHFGGRVNSVAFSPDSKLIASASDDWMVRLWDSSGEHRCTLDGRRLEGRSYSHVTTGEQRSKLEGHFNYVKAVAFSPDGKLVASASNDKTVRLWGVQGLNPPSPNVRLRKSRSPSS